MNIGPDFFEDMKRPARRIKFKLDLLILKGDRASGNLLRAQSVGEFVKSKQSRSKRTLLAIKRRLTFFVSETFGRTDNCFVKISFQNFAGRRHGDDDRESEFILIRFQTA